MNQFEKEQLNEIKSKYGDLTKIENFKNAVCRHQIKIPQIGKRESVVINSKDQVLQMNQTLNRVRTFADRTQRNKSMVINKQEVAKTILKPEPNFGGITLKEKLERFYYAYNKSLVFEDGMSFSECDSQDNNSENDFSATRPNKKWSLLQKFICQTNIQRFEDNLENISKEIRCPTPNYIKKKKIYRQRKARQANAILPQKNRNGPIVIPASGNFQKEFNNKLLSPIGKEVLESQALPNSISCDNNNDAKENDEPNLEPLSEDSPTDENEKDQDIVAVSFDQIYGAFCKRYRKKKSISKDFQSSRNCQINRDMCQTLEPIKISTHHDDDAIRTCTKPFPLDSSMFKFRFSQIGDNESRNSFETSPASLCGRTSLIKDKFKKSFQQAESFDLHHQNASTKYSSIAEDFYGEPMSPTLGSEAASLFRTSIHFPRPLPTNKILDHSYIPKPKSNENETRLAQKKVLKTKFNLKDINKKKNIENLKMKPKKRKISMRSRSIVPTDFKF